MKSCILRVANIFANRISTGRNLRNRAFLVAFWPQKSPRNWWFPFIKQMTLDVASLGAAHLLPGRSWAQTSVEKHWFCNRCLRFYTCFTAVYTIICFTTCFTYNNTTNYTSNQKKTPFFPLQFVFLPKTKWPMRRSMSWWTKQLHVGPSSPHRLKKQFLRHRHRHPPQKRNGVFNGKSEETPRQQWISGPPWRKNRVKVSPPFLTSKNEKNHHGDIQKPNLKDCNHQQECCR